jgi:hypothetical protein
MKLNSIVNPFLPKLAWVAEVDRISLIVALVHGTAVEVREKFFIEGVWNGPFQDGDFGESDCVFGSGGVLNDQSIRFVTSASTTDYLYYAEGEGHVTVSNSLPLLLASIKDALDPRCLDYARICESIIDGIDDYRRDIPTKKGKIRRLMYRNLNVSRERISESEKRMPPEFTCFRSYRDYLRNNYALIAANARDGARTEPLEIFSTQSKGYDSTAVNAIASPYGIDKVFTVSKAKSTYFMAHNEESELPDDDGGKICESLGLNCIRLNRHAFTKEFDQEDLYYCAVNRSHDADLKDIGKHISKAGILLTGTLGEIWYTRDSFSKSLGEGALTLDCQLRRVDLSGHGMSELRLVDGFIHLPLPFIGARRRSDIANITESSEMDPWRLGNRYDRPIPRRIAEEAGVPRQAFGQSKMGAGVIFAQPSIPYGKALRREFFDYLVDEKIMARSTAVLWPIVREANSILQRGSVRLYGLVYYCTRVISKLCRRNVTFKLMWMKHSGALFCFCVNRTAKRYSKHLR